MEKRELDEMRVSIYEKLRRAIREGDKEKALGLLGEIDRNRENYRDMYLTWVDLLLTYIADNLGEEAVFKTMRVLYQQVGRPRVIAAVGEPALGPTSAEDRVRRRAYLWTSAHGSDIDEIQEDREKFTIKLKCPTGGAIRTREQFGKTKEAHPWSYGQKGFSYYCAHCPSSFEIMSIEQFGYPVWVTLPQPGGRCSQYLYKDPESVPEEYYRRVGMEKKAR